MSQSDRTILRSHQLSAVSFQLSGVYCLSSVVRGPPKLGTDFVIYTRRHTFGTRLGESRADAFTIMRVMGHSTVTVSQRYVHPTPETLERAFERHEERNRRAMKRMEEQNRHSTQASRTAGIQGRPATLSATVESEDVDTVPEVA